MSDPRPNLPLAVTTGDPAGIGPELALKAWRREIAAPNRIPFGHEHTRGTLLCPSGFDSNGMLRQRGRRMTRRAHTIANTQNARHDVNAVIDNDSSATANTEVAKTDWNQP